MCIDIIATANIAYKSDDENMAYKPDDGDTYLDIVIKNITRLKQLGANKCFSSFLITL